MPRETDGRCCGEERKSCQDDDGCYMATVPWKLIVKESMPCISQIPCLSAPCHSPLSSSMVCNIGWCFACFHCPGMSLRPPGRTLYFGGPPGFFGGARVVEMSGGGDGECGDVGRVDRPPSADGGEPFRAAALGLVMRKCCVVTV